MIEIKCIQCEKQLQVKDFYESKVKLNGLQSRCKACHKITTMRYKIMARKRAKMELGFWS